MAEKSAPTRPATMNDIGALLKRRKENLSALAAATAAENAIVAVVAEQTAKVTTPLMADNQAIEQAVKEYLVSRRRNILRRHGKTFVLEGTEIKWRVIPKSLEVPADVTGAINYLAHRPDGESYLRKTLSLDKDALKGAPLSILRGLRAFGIVAANHEQLTIKSPSEDEPRLLWRQRFPRGRVQ